MGSWDCGSNEIAEIVIWVQTLSESVPGQVIAGELTHFYQLEQLNG